MHKAILASLAFLFINSAGCVHLQLQHDQASQARSISSLYEQQVLDNIAMFKQNPNAVPFFTVVGSGGAKVVEDGNISVAPLNGPGHTTLAMPRLARSHDLSFTTKPVSDPKRLELMRCAYRRAVGLQNSGDQCVDCCQLENLWKGMPVSSYCDPCDCCRIQPLQTETGGWRFRHSSCEKIGRYCGSYVKVCPNSYGDFSRLVLTILDYAINDPTPPPAAKAEPVANVTHYHYVLDEKTGGYVFDNQGRPIVDYVDSFLAKPHAFKGSERKIETRDKNSVLEDVDVSPIELDSYPLRMNPGILRQPTQPPLIQSEFLLDSQFKQDLDALYNLRVLTEQQRLQN